MEDSVELPGDDGAGDHGEAAERHANLKNALASGAPTVALADDSEEKAGKPGKDSADRYNV